MSYQAALQLLVEVCEGGYALSELPGDAGGLTYAGISQTMWLKTGNKPYSERLPTETEVANWYNRYFWYPAHCPDLPEPADAVFLQLTVNIGTPSKYLSLLQCAVGARPVDGVWGGKTLAATQVIGRDEFPYLLLAVQDAYYRFAATSEYQEGLLNRTSKVRGWLRLLHA